MKNYFILRAYIAVLDNLVFLGWLHQDGFLSFRRVNMEKYILYARKSTDTEDKQILSIDAQLAELRKFARDNHLVVIDELIEKTHSKNARSPDFQFYD